MFDPERLLQQMVGGALGGAFGGRGRSRGGIGSMLGGNKAALGVGLLGVAFAAYEHYNRPQAADGKSVPAPPPAPLATGQPPMPPTAMPPPPPPPPPMIATSGTAPTRAQPMLDLHRQEAALMVRAMIAAAAADGQIDADERARILGRARDAVDDAETIAFLDAELAAPASLDDLVAQTPRSLAEPVYAASAVAIAVDTDAERAYLDQLAQRLGIDPQRRAQFEAQLGQG